MNKYTAKPENTTKRDREQSAAPLLVIREKFKDPEIIRDFKNWQEARKNTQRSAKA